MPEMPITEAREDLAAVINKVAFGNERVQLTRHGKAVAALVSAADLALLETIEDRMDLEAVAAALADPENVEPVPWEQVKQRLGL